MPVIPILPSINTCTTSTSTITSTSALKVPEVNTTQLQALADVCSSVTGAETITLPNVVMNSLVSPTKVVTNDSLPNTIVSSSISMPLTPIPVSSIGIPIMSMKTDSDCDKIDEKPFLDVDGDKLCNNKKLDEPMPEDNEEDGVLLQMATHIEENITETDVEVTDSSDILDKCKDDIDDITKDDKVAVNGTGPERMTVVETNFSSNNTAEPMECVSISTSMASPKHIMVNDIIMLETVSVNY